jgi:hypothetical protein
MKFCMAFASLCAVVATSSLMSMEQQGKVCSNFIVNHNLKIKGYSQYAAEPSEFMNKRITRIFPLNHKDFESFQLGFRRASGAQPEISDIVKVPYTSDQKNFVAKIVALQTAEQDKHRMKDNYCVKLQEKAHVGENYIEFIGYNLFVNHSKRCLNFLVNNEKCITGFSRQNMEFAIKPSEFVGKNIIDILPLDEKDHNAVALGFCRAVEKEETVKVPYELNDMNFIAKITALKTAEENVRNYFVKIQEAKK